MDRGIGGRSEPFRASPLAGSLRQRLAKEKTQLTTEAGLRARAKLEYERDQLRSMLAQALRIQIEVSRQEREALEGSLAAGSQVEVVQGPALDPRGLRRAALLALRGRVLARRARDVLLHAHQGLQGPPAPVLGAAEPASGRNHP